jgi:hypothetical protein
MATSPKVKSSWRSRLTCFWGQGNERGRKQTVCRGPSPGNPEGRIPVPGHGVMSDMSLGSSRQGGEPRGGEGGRSFAWGRQTGHEVASSPGHEPLARACLRGGTSLTRWKIRYQATPGLALAHGRLPAHLAPSGRCKSNGIRRLRGLVRRIRSLASRLHILRPVRQPSLGPEPRVFFPAVA